MGSKGIAQLATPDWLLVEYVEHGRTMTSIAVELGCTKAAISRALHRHHIPSRHPPTGRPGNNRPPRALDENAIRRRLDSGESLTRIAASLNISRTTLTTRLDLRGQGHRPARFEILDDVTWVRDQYDRQRRSLANIASEVGCSTSAVRSALNRAGILVRPYGKRALAQLDVAELQRRWTAGETIGELATDLGITDSTLRHRLNRLDAGIGHRKRVDARLNDPDWLHQRYVIDQRSMQQIAGELGCGDTAVLRAVHRHNLPRRPASRPRSRPRPVTNVLELSTANRATADEVPEHATASKYVARMPLMENVEKKIFKIEGFQVHIHHEAGPDIRADKANVPQYPYKRALKNTKTVAGWRNGRFANHYPGYTVKVYTADGTEATGNTRLSSLRDTYLDDE